MRPTRSTVIFRVKGSDLAAFRAGRMTLEEARKKVEISSASTGREPGRRRPGVSI